MAMAVRLICYNPQYAWSNTIQCPIKLWQNIQKTKISTNLQPAGVARQLQLNSSPQFWPSVNHCHHQHYSCFLLHFHNTRSQPSPNKMTALNYMEKKKTYYNERTEKSCSHEYEFGHQIFHYIKTAGWTWTCIISNNSNINSVWVTTCNCSEL